METALSGRRRGRFSSEGSAEEAGAAGGREKTARERERDEGEAERAGGCEDSGGVERGERETKGLSVKEREKGAREKGKRKRTKGEGRKGKKEGE